MKENIDIALIGCGKMGRALLRGWLAAGIENRVYVLDPAGLPEEFAEYAPNPVTFFNDAGAFAAHAPQADVYVMAVKPQIMEDVCTALAPAMPPDALVLSIAAGQTIAAFERRFAESQPVIRAMPNTPAAIGKGITVAVANGRVSAAQKAMADAILQAAGKVAWVAEESLLDPVTALSGSGPAYVFFLIEALAEAGAAAGLDPDFAMTLARETVTGAAALAVAEPDVPASKLRENVTSPGGTTAAALEILMNGDFQDVLNKAVAAATARSRELSR